jgi:hypothetical protein
VRALVLNCTLEPSPAESNTEALAGSSGRVIGAGAVRPPRWSRRAGTTTAS